MKLYYCLMALLCPAVTISIMRMPVNDNIPVNHEAIITDTIKPLRIGDQVPDIILDSIVNYNVSSAKLSDLRQKRAIILDFFATWCGPCVQALPHLDSIRNLFKDELQIVAITNESAKVVQAFLKEKVAMQGLTLPFVTSDSILSALFRHKLIPHEVWINKSGKVQAITGAESVTIKNVRSLIAGMKLALPAKEDVLTYSRSKPLLEDGNGGNESLLLYRGILTKYIEGLFSGHRRVISLDSSIIRISHINIPLLGLYYMAGMKTLNSSNRLILEVPGLADSTNISGSHTAKSNRARSNVYCYEISVPISMSEQQIDALMLDDLNRNLGLYGRIEKRTISCVALVRTSDVDLLQSKGGAPIAKLYGPNKDKLLQNQPLSTLIKALNNQAWGQPLKSVVVDETGYKGMVDLRLPVYNIDSLPALRSALNEYGLDIISVKRELPMFVISKTHTNR